MTICLTPDEVNSFMSKFRAWIWTPYTSIQNILYQIVTELWLIRPETRWWKREAVSWWWRVTTIVWIWDGIFPPAHPLLSSGRLIIDLPHIQGGACGCQFLVCYLQYCSPVLSKSENLLIIIPGTRKIKVLRPAPAKISISVFHLLFCLIFGCSFLLRQRY